MGLRVPTTMDDELKLELELELLVPEVTANLDPVHTKLSGEVEVSDTLMLPLHWG